MLSIDVLGNNMYTLFDVIQSNNEVSIHAEKIQKFFSLKSTIENKVEGLVPSLPFEIELRDVDFGYLNHQVIKHMNLHISKGEKIGIVGENGVGKSTLVKLLLRLYDVNGGEILINGTNIKKYNLEALRKSMGVVFQTPNIFSLSLLENASLYQSKNADELVKELQRLKLSNETNMNTLMTKEFDENGVVFSKGQEQKFALTRLLGNEFGLVVLDEPSAALDPFAEKEMMNLIDEISKTTTTIIISHRLSTVVDCDKIVVLDDGCVIEEGTHNDLMNQKGKYYQMFTEQAEKYLM